MMSHLQFYKPRKLVLTLAMSCLLAASPCVGEDWSSELGVNYGRLDISGSADSFRSQMNLSEGFSLDEFHFSLKDSDSTVESLKIRAWGFGNAENNAAFRLDLRTHSSFRLQLNYDRGETFLALSDPDLSSTRENWTLDRWMADLSYTGWKHWGLGLSYHRTDRNGSIHQPDFGLNETYPIKLRLDETMDDVGLRLESHDLPVYLLFEQSFARYTRNSRPSADGANSISNPDDPDLLELIDSSQKDRVDIPTSRAMASWKTDRFEGLASILYSKSDLDATGGLSRSYAVDGGSVGEMSFIDEIASSTKRDMLSGDLRLGFVLAPSWILRLSGRYQDSSADSELFGRALLRAVNPAGGSFDIEGSLDDRGAYDFTDRNSRLSLEYRLENLSLWGGGFTGSRDVSWKRSEDGENVDLSRNTDGYLLGAAWTRGAIDASAEYESGTFEHYVFRTDPEKVDRLTVKLRAKLHTYWTVGIHGRFENAENPSEIAALDRDSQSWGMNLGWTSKDARQGVNLSFDKNRLESDVALILPGDETGLSYYDLDLSTISLSGHANYGITHARASLTHINDEGDSFPLSAWKASGRLGWDASSAVRIGVFAQYWDYNEDASNLDDFSATRYGVFLHWSSQS